MPTQRQIDLNSRVELLIKAFPALLDFFLKDPPFRKHGQLDVHRETIQARVEAETAKNAIRNMDYLEGLYRTLRAWGIGARGSRLVSFKRFERAFRDRESEIEELETLAIDQSEMDVIRTSRKLWKIINELEIVENKTKLVPCTKALHHLLPNLVVPMDREYTQIFFGWHNPEFQYDQKGCFMQAFKVFFRVARAVNPMQYVENGSSSWNTSRTKVIDNAIV